MAPLSRAAAVLLLVSLVLVATSWQLMRRRRPLSLAKGDELSHFLPHAGGCAWYRLAMSAQGKMRDAQQIVVLPNDCDGLNVTLAPDGKSALIWFDSPGSSLGETPAAFWVDIDRGSFRRLPAPDLTDMVTMSFTKQGKPAAFGFEPNVLVETDADGSRRVIRHGGLTYPAVDGQDGIDALAIMQLWRDPTESSDGSWQPAQLAASRCCGDAVVGLDALPAYVELAQARLLQRLTGASCVDTDAALLVQTPDRYGTSLQPYLPPPSFAQRSLVRLARADWSYALLGWRDDPQSPLFSPLFFEHGDELMPLPWPLHVSSWAPDVRLDAAVRGPFLLITEHPTGTQALLFDMRHGRLVWSERMAMGACFWPSRKEHVPS